MKKTEVLARYTELEAQLKDIYNKLSAIKEQFEARNWGSSMASSIPWALAAINSKRQDYVRERRRFAGLTEAEIETLDFVSAFESKAEEIEGYMCTYRTFKNMI